MLAGRRLPASSSDTDYWLCDNSIVVTWRGIYTEISSDLRYLNCHPQTNHIANSQTHLQSWSTIRFGKPTIYGTEVERAIVQIRVTNGRSGTRNYTWLLFRYFASCYHYWL